MENRIALIGILVEDYGAVEKLNALLHDYRDFIISRMGLPYHHRHTNIISIGIDAPVDTINALTGKIGMLDGVESKTVISKETKK